MPALPFAFTAMATLRGAEMSKRALSGVVVLLLAFGLTAPAGALTARRPAAAPARSQGKHHGKPAPPTAIGPYAVGRTTFNVTDPKRAGRTLPVDVWYPSEPSAVVGATKSRFDLLVTSAESPLAYADTPVAPGTQFPLVIFSHGSGGIRFQSYFLTEFLASHGFIVAAPDHVGNTALDELSGTTAPFAVTARNRPLDVSLVIDRMLERNASTGDAFRHSIDPARIAVIGHSFGGFTALAMAAGFGDIAPDPRVRAIVPIAPASQPFTDAELSSITVPMLLLGGTSDVTTPIVPNTTRPWDLVSSKTKYRVDIDRAGHASFTNICDLVDELLGAGLPPAFLSGLQSLANEGCAPGLRPIGQVQELTNLYTLAFLERTLNHGHTQKYLTAGYARSHHLPVTFYRR